MLRECDSRMAVEDFGTPLNPMLGRSAVLVTSEEEGITMLAAMLRHGPASSHKGIFDSWLQARAMDYNARKMSSEPVLGGRAA